ncbi:MAG TPA: DUF3999 domain-containing protein [Rhodanobacteraceae bacterium]|nr:DUF3999 domain-containing protein [Rhodanobacteraceae bacterium]
MRRLVALTLLLPALSPAARDDYARQWSLTMQDPGAGAYRVVLDAPVYRSASLPSLRDVDVFNGDGKPVPAALFAPQAPAAQAPHRIALPWFALPPGQATPADDITLISERDADGHVQRVETRVANAAQLPEKTANAWLIDASRLQQRVVALQLDWPPPTSALDVVYRVEGSDDLRDWRTLQPRAQLLDLMRDGQRLRQRRIPLDGQARYLRLLPIQPDAALPLTGVQAELASTPLAPDWQWVDLRGHSVIEGGRTFYDFTLDGRFPVARADVGTAGNDAGEWTLQSRDDADAPWQTRAGPWVAFRIGKGAIDRSAAQHLNAIVRDRYWRLSSHPSAAGVPTLRLGYRPEVVVFLARGKPPFALVAGSARAFRADAPLPHLIDTMRRQRGGDWRPAAATLGTAQLLSGPQALVPAPPERDWKAWLLWALLIAGALVVAGFAITLLRKLPATR